jgi:hypothetical protein
MQYGKPDRAKGDTMTEHGIWGYREAILGEESTGDMDLVGFAVEAIDGSIGKVDEASHDIGRSYIVVDTGHWIFGRRVVLPAGVIERVDPEHGRIFVGRTKDEIKSAPPYDDVREAPHTDFDTYWTTLSNPDYLDPLTHNRPF